MRQSQGVARGFLNIRDAAGKVIGYGDVTITTRGSVVTSHVTYRFHDGSLDEETAVYSQRGSFRMLSDHHVQRGAFFKEAIDITVNGKTGEVTSHEVEKNGKAKDHADQIEIASDLSNGILGAILTNISPATPKLKFPFIAASGKGRMVTLEIEPSGTGNCRIRGINSKANIFRIHIDLHGLKGVIAPIVGKQPDDVFVWVLPGAAPALLRQTGALYANGPHLSIEQAAASFTPLDSSK